MNKFLAFFTLIILCLKQASSKTAEEWKSRTIYEIVIDRFAKTNDDTTPCSNLNNYCGGTFKGIEKNLDYIQGMGFNAIWISPVQEASPGAYHGYWTTNFYEINHHFGTDQDLHDLITACHHRDIWVMADVAANHIGYLQEMDKIKDTENNDYSKIVPFNKPEHYHKYEIECHDAERQRPDDADILETCWLFWLPDLNQDNPFVRKALLEWVNWFVKTYKLDGLRLDALRHVKKQFWKEFGESAGVFTLGEAWDKRVKFSAEFQKYVDSILNFPLHFKLTDAFAQGHPMTEISEYYEQAYQYWPDITVLANFMDCHDKVRFLSYANDITSFKATLAFTISSVGIPTIYYGSEQSFKGGDDPANRENLWGHMDTKSELYQFLKTLNKFRTDTEYYKHEQKERFVDKYVYAFSRDKYFFVFTNSLEIQNRAIENHSYEDGTVLCNIMREDDCVEVEKGKFPVTLADREFKILSPQKNSKLEAGVAKVWDGVKQAIGSAVGTDTSTSS